MGSFPDLMSPIIRDIREQQEWAAPWEKPNWVLSVKPGGQQCPPQQGPSATMPKADEQSSFGCIKWSEESLKAKLKWWSTAQVKLRSQVSQCGLVQWRNQAQSYCSDPRQVWSETAGRSRFWNASQEVKFPGQDLDQQDTSPGTDRVVL